MRLARNGFVFQLLAALAIAALLSLALWHAGQLAMLVVLFPLLTLASLAAIGVLRTRLSMRRPPLRGRGWGGGWGQRGDGWDATGVREPRRPYPPSYPSRGEVVEPPVPSA